MHQGHRAFLKKNKTCAKLAQLRFGSVPVIYVAGVDQRKAGDQVGNGKDEVKDQGDDAEELEEGLLLLRKEVVEENSGDTDVGRGADYPNEAYQDRAQSQAQSAAVGRDKESGHVDRFPDSTMIYFSRTLSGLSFEQFFRLMGQPLFIGLLTCGFLSRDNRVISLVGG